MDSGSSSSPSISFLDNPTPQLALSYRASGQAKWWLRQFITKKKLEKKKITLRHVGKRCGIAENLQYVQYQFSLYTSFASMAHAIAWNHKQCCKPVLRHGSDKEKPIQKKYKKVSHSTFIPLSFCRINRMKLRSVLRITSTGTPCHIL